MGGSAGSGGGGQPQMGGQPSQMPAQAQGMQGRIQGMADKFQGMPSAPGVAQGTQAGPLGQTNMPAHQDWRSQMNAGQQGGMEWLEQLKQMRPQYGQSARAGNFRGGMGRRAITNPGSFSAAQAGSGGPGEEITAPAAVAGAPSSGQGGNAPANAGPSPGQGNSANASQDIIQALRSRMG